MAPSSTDATRFGRAFAIAVSLVEDFVGSIHQLICRAPVFSNHGSSVVQGGAGKPALARPVWSFCLLSCAPWGRHRGKPNRRSCDPLSHLCSCCIRLESAARSAFAVVDDQRPEVGVVRVLRLSSCPDVGRSLAPPSLDSPAIGWCASTPLLGRGAPAKARIGFQPSFMLTPPSRADGFRRAPAPGVPSGRPVAELALSVGVVDQQHQTDA